MKRIIATVFAICLVATVTCISSFALTISSNDVIRVHGLKSDGTTTVILNGYTKHDEGWEAAVDYAEDHDFMDENGYERIVVDFLADWKANDKGEFGKSSWDGFQYSTIYVPSDTRITINLNGHKIDRGLKEYEYDGEVICINDDADLIINGGKSGDPIIEPGKDPGDVKMGTITGGFSCNGAGGIHMQDGSRLTLNNVNVIGNSVEDDDGAGIAVYDGAILTMNGGSLSNNICYNFADNQNGGCGIYVNDSTAVLNSTVIQNNHFKKYFHAKGAALYSTDSDVTIKNCKIIGNGNLDESLDYVGADAVIYGTGGSLNITNTYFEGNGYPIRSGGREGSLIYSKADLNIDGCVFTANHTVYLIDSEGEHLRVSNTEFKDNDANVFYGYGKYDIIAFSKCNFNNNVSSSAINDIYTFEFTSEGTVFYDCDLGNSTMNDEECAEYTDSPLYDGTHKGSGGYRIGSIFGEGSLSMIVAILALATSAASVCLTVALNKKKSGAAVTNAEQPDDEDEE